MSSYKELNLKRIKALHDRACSLFYGKDVYMGGDEWCQTCDDEKEIQAHQIIARVYREIVPYKEEIFSDIKKYEEKYPIAIWEKDYNMLSVLRYVIKLYEDETQYLLELEKETHNDGTNMPSLDLLEFIKYPKKQDFLMLFQTIVNNRIDNGIERAAITYIIYNSSLFNRSQYHEWKPFYRQFCKDIGWKATSYKPNRLTDTIKILRSKFFWVDTIK